MTLNRSFMCYLLLFFLFFFLCLCFATQTILLANIEIPSPPLHRIAMHLLSLHSAFFLLIPFCCSLLLSYIKYDWNNLLLCYFFSFPFLPCSRSCCRFGFTSLLCDRCSFTTLANGCDQRQRKINGIKLNNWRILVLILLLFCSICVCVCVYRCVCAHNHLTYIVCRS